MEVHLDERGGAGVGDEELLGGVGAVAGVGVLLFVAADGDGGEPGFSGEGVTVAVGPVVGED